MELHCCLIYYTDEDVLIDLSHWIQLPASVLDPYYGVALSPGNLSMAVVRLSLHLLPPLFFSVLGDICDIHDVFGDQ